MVIVGEWRTCDDGVARPAVQAQVGGASAAKLAEYFLVDSGADLSILGRDVLNHFDVILSRRNNDLLLLAPNHHYRVEGE